MTNTEPDDLPTAASVKTETKCLIHVFQIRHRLLRNEFPIASCVMLTMLRELRYTLPRSLVTIESGCSAVPAPRSSVLTYRLSQFELRQVYPGGFSSRQGGENTDRNDVRWSGCRNLLTEFCERARAGNVRFHVQKISEFLLTVRHCIPHKAG